MELHKKGYISQAAIYLRNKDYSKAYSFAKEFIAKFPDEIIAYYFLSAAAFWLKKYDEAAVEGRKAFNKADNYDDMLPCAIITASAYYEMDQFDKGFEILTIMEKKKKTEELEKLLFLFSVAKNDGKEAVVHLDELYKLNRQAADQMAARYSK